MTDLFQQSRLAEQLQLSMDKRRMRELKLVDVSRWNEGGEFLTRMDEAIHRHCSRNGCEYEATAITFERAIVEYEI